MEKMLHIHAANTEPARIQTDKLAYTYADAAPATGVSVRTFERLVSTGALPASYAAGRKPVILADTLYAFLKAGEVVKNV
jgi:excisionase family DNA binding protein